MFLKKFIWASSLLSLLVLASCGNDDSNDSTTQGDLQVEITDGPIDDAEVKSVFVTVAEVKFDGKTFSGFSGKKTIDVKALTQGNTQVLGLGKADVGSYTNITLVLDNSKDASGNAPGSYVETVNGTKHALSTTATQEITIAKNYAIESTKSTTLVFDMDLRKIIAYQDNATATDKYDFVSSSNLNSAVRVVIKDQAGSITGTCNNAIVSSDKIVAYAYKKGTYNKATETQSANGIDFKNAVSSAIVNSNGQFNISFLESGDYELHFAAYKDNNSDGKLELLGELSLNSALNLSAITVTANAQVTIAATVLGLL
jgi:Domain of unknown function (DUF4382)